MDTCNNVYNLMAHGNKLDINERREQVHEISYKHIIYRVLCISHQKVLICNLMYVFSENTCLNPHCYICMKLKELTDIKEVLRNLKFSMRTEELEIFWYILIMISLGILILIRNNISRCVFLMDEDLVIIKVVVHHHSFND